jgi:hypothetical protein
MQLQANILMDPIVLVYMMVANAHRVQHAGLLEKKLKNRIRWR